MEMASWLKMTDDSNLKTQSWIWREEFDLVNLLQTGVISGVPEQIETTTPVCVIKWMLVLEARKKFKIWKEIGRHNCERLVNFHRLFCLLLSLLVYLFLKHIVVTSRPQRGALSFPVCPRQPNQGLQLCKTNALTCQKGSWTLIACGEMHTFYFTFLLVMLFLFLMSIKIFLSLFVPCQRSKS